MQHAPSLQLDRRLQNHAFESWKIGSNFVASRSSAQLPGSIFQGAADAVDFAHTRASLLCNHLFSSQGRLFTVTAAGGGSVLRVDEVLVQQQGGQHAVPGTAHVAGEQDCCCCSGRLTVCRAVAEVLILSSRRMIQLLSWIAVGSSGPGCRISLYCLISTFPLRCLSV